MANFELYNKKADGTMELVDMSSDKAKKIFTGTDNARNYVGTNIAVGTVYSGTYCFTNCTGSVTVSGTSAKVYVVNSPNFVVYGITSDNWRNVYIDGIAEYVYVNTWIEIASSTSPANNRKFYSATFAAGDELDALLMYANASIASICHVKMTPPAFGDDLAVFRAQNWSGEAQCFGVCAISDGIGWINGNLATLPEGDKLYLSNLAARRYL